MRAGAESRARGRRPPPPEVFEGEECPVCGLGQVVRGVASAALHCACPGARAERVLLGLPAVHVEWNEIPAPRSVWEALAPAAPAEVRNFYYQAVDAFWPSPEAFRRDAHHLRARRGLLVPAGPPRPDGRRPGWVAWRFTVNCPPPPDCDWPEGAIPPPGPALQPRLPGC